MKSEQLAKICRLEEFIKDDAVDLNNKPVAQRLLSRLEDDVLKCSMFSREVVVYIHWYYMRRCQCLDSVEFQKLFNHKPNFLAFFNMLGDVDSMNAHISFEYATLRRKYNLPVYNMSMQTALFEDMSAKYERIFMDNIVSHMYVRVLNFFLNFYPEQQKCESYSGVLDVLFNEKPKYTADVEHLQFFHKTFPEVENFYDLKNNYYKYVPFLIKLQQKCIAIKTKVFTVFPIYKPGRQYIQYRQAAIHSLLKSMNLIPATTPVADIEYYARRYFTVDSKLYQYLCTDGVTVSLYYESADVIPRRPSREKPWVSKFSDNIQRRFKNNEYEHVIGLDTGLNLAFAGVSKDLLTGAQRIIKLSGEILKAKTGGHTRQEFHLEWTRDILEKTRTALSTKSLEQYSWWTSHHLRHFVESQTVFCHRKLAELDSQWLISNAECAMKTANRLLLHTNPKKTLVLVGTTFLERPRGSIPLPLAEVVSELKKRADVAVIDEYMSTKICSSCFDCETTKLLHRKQRCSKCGVNWNRDVNAGINIMKLGLLDISGRRRPDIFRRKFTYNSDVIRRLKE